MYRNMCCAMALAVAWGAAPAAYAQEADLAKIRDEIRQLREAYERRIEALEMRLAAAEAQRGRAEERAAPSGAAAAPQRERSVGENAFNPAISLILQGAAARSSRDPADYQLTGFAPSGGEVAPARRSFSLGESELVVSANIDPYFRGQLIAALTPENEVEVEEAYFETLALGRGFRLKGGRFLSAVGYQNELHPHAWDFADAPLAYQAYFGGRLNDDGAQLKWVAPTDLFLELGAELGRGRSFPASERSRNAAGAWTVFVHVGGDLAASTAWRAGLSHVRASPRGRTFEDRDALGNPVSQSFSGTSRLWIADFVLKWAPGGNATQTNFKLQGEYFRRNESGSLTYDDSTQAAPQFGASFSGDYRSRQSGWYLQGVYQFMPRWRFGYRHDRLDSGRVNNGIVASGAGPAAADFPLLMTAHEPTRHTLMLDWGPTEFSRLRLQLASDKSRFGATDRQVLLQYIFSLGAHGAHRF